MMFFPQTSRDLSDLEILFFQPAVGKEYGIISLGFLSLSAYLRKHGYDSRIIVMADKNTEETIEKKILEFRPKVACISLHWYIHSYEALKIAETVKKIDPDIRVVVGGHTSTYFDKQLLEFTPSIDLIIKGDGEKPLLDYLSTGDPNTVDNTSFMKGGEFVSKPVTYRQISLDNLSAANENMAEMVDEWDKYLNTPRVRTSAPISHEKIVEKIETKPCEFYLFVGKGCSYNCCFCGTSKSGSTRIFSRGISIFRPIEDVVKDARNLKNNGVKSLFLDFGPFQDETYYHKLFDRLADLEVDLTFLPWNLPSEDLISKISKSFKHFDIQISPDSGSESLRKRLCKLGFHKQFFSNKRIVKSVEKTAEVGSSRDAQMFLWFFCGLPFENEKDFQETIDISVSMKNSFPQLFKNPWDQLNCIPLRLTPGAPIDIFPEKFGIKRLRRSFKDYYEYCMELETGRITHPLGLEREDLSEEDIIKRAVYFKDTIVCA